MLVTRILEIIFIVLILRALFSMVMQLVHRKPKGDHEQVKRYEEDRFDKKKMDIVDGEFKELK